MAKYEDATGFYNHYIKLTDSKKDEFSRIANKLLSVNYLTSHLSKDKDDYYFIINQLETFKAYFSILDYYLEYYEADSVICLINKNNYNHLLLRKNESIVLLVLRKLYFKKMQEISLTDNISISLTELHEELLVTGLFSRRLNKSELKDMLSLFKRYNLCYSLDSSLNDDTQLILLPTILYVVLLNRVEEVNKQIESYQKSGEINEKTS